MVPGQTVILVKPFEPGGPLERNALVLDVVEDLEGTVTRRAVNLAFVSPDATDVTPFGRALKTIVSVPHESCRNIGPLRFGEYWYVRGGVA